MSDVTAQFDLPPWVRVRQIYGTGFYLEDERGWFAFARRDWQVPVVFELMAGVVPGLLAARPGPDPSGHAVPTPSSTSRAG